MAHLLGILGKVLLFGIHLGLSQSLAQLLHVVSGIFLVLRGILVLALLQALISILLVLLHLLLEFLRHAEIGAWIELLVVLFYLVDVLLELLELLIHSLLLLHQLLFVLAAGLLRFTRNIALFLGQLLHFLDGLLHLLLNFEALHELDVLVELLLKLCIVNLKLFELLLHLLFVELLHHTLNLGHGLLHLVVHHLVHEAVQLALLLHELFALFAILLFQTVILLNLLLHLLHHLAHLFLLLGNLLQFLLLLPAEFLLVHQLAHHLVDLLLQALQLRHLVFCTLAHVGRALLQQAVELVGRRNLNLIHLRACRFGAMDGVVVRHLEPVGEDIARGQRQFSCVEREVELLRRTVLKGNFSLADGLSGRIGSIGGLMDKHELREAVIVFYAPTEEVAVGAQRVGHLLDGNHGQGVLDCGD